jgi:hypothetical protein
MRCMSFILRFTADSPTSPPLAIQRTIQRTNTAEHRHFTPIVVWESACN